MNKVIQLSKHRDTKITKNIVPERLQKARKAKLMTQTDLASEIGLTRQAISAFEQGTRQPEASTLINISNELEQPISYFIEKSPASFGQFSAKTYRAFGSATRKRNDQCDVLSEWTSVTVSYLDKLINFPEPNIPEVAPPNNGKMYTEEEIEIAADLVRKIWGLGFGPIGNLTKLIESKGIFICQLPIIDDKINAFCYWNGAKPFIITGGSNTTAVRRRFDLAHELGHLVLHQGISDVELEDKKTLKAIEDEANYFAGAFLLPMSSYPNEIFSGSLNAFLELKSRWKVSISAQIYRCNNLGLFSDKQILNMRKQISFKKWRTKEPLDDSLQIECPSMIHKATRMVLDANVISPESMFVDINISKKIMGIISGIEECEFMSNSEIAMPLTMKGNTRK